MPVACLSIRAAREDPAGAVHAPSFLAEVNAPPEVLLPAVLGSCTGLYVAVRRIGGADGPAHGHIDDMHRARLS